MTHADLRQLVERAHIADAFYSHAPKCFSLFATDGEWRVFRDILLKRPSEALLNQQAEHLADLLADGVDTELALTLTLVNCTQADEGQGDDDLGAAMASVPEDWFIYGMGETVAPIRHRGDLHAHLGFWAEVQHRRGGLLSKGSSGASLAEAVRDAVAKADVGRAQEVHGSNSSDPTTNNSSGATTSSPEVDIPGDEVLELPAYALGTRVRIINPRSMFKDKVGHVEVTRDGPRPLGIRLAGEDERLELIWCNKAELEVI
jgi:hypothetical protein